MNNLSRKIRLLTAVLVLSVLFVLGGCFSESSSSETTTTENLQAPSSSLSTELFEDKENITLLCHVGLP